MSTVHYERSTLPQSESIETSSGTQNYKFIHTRSIEVDLIRGIAVVLMVMFHLSYDLKVFAKLSFDLPTWYWRWVPELIAPPFFFIVGLSLWLSFKRQSISSSFSVVMKKGLKLCLIAIGITLSTALFMPPNYIIYFGVIHCIATCIVMSYPFLRNRRYNFILGLLFIVIGITLLRFRFPFPWFLWLGFWPESGITGGDWYPLLPWFGVVLFGIAAGEKLYPPLQDPQSLLSAMWARNRIICGLSFLGRHSLFIYLIHQPLFVGIIHIVIQF
ncbi:MAG: DUF1624 domain-containing protein [Proteobacteria bacterium]|nr:DUF1624 domain-containing protein [Pseudomonadota bacterium]